MELVSTKILVLTLLGVLRLFFGLVPLKITKKLKIWGESGVSHKLVERRKKQVDLAISLCLCFGGGVLLATCFIHMIPEVRESLEAVKARHLLPETEFPLAELFICCGFFLVYVIEEIAHKVFGGHVHSEALGHESAEQQQQCSTIEAEYNKQQEGTYRTSKGVVTTNGTYVYSIGTGERFTFCGDPDAVSWNKNLSSKITPSTSQVHLLASSLSLENDSSSSAGKDQQVTLRTPSVPPSQSLIIYTQNQNRSNNNNYNTSTLRRQQSADTPAAKRGLKLESLKHKSIVGSLRSFLVVVALSFHSIFEGLAIGLQLTQRDVWYLFTAVSIHACAILFCIGLELVTSGTKLLNLVLYIVTLALVSPLGVAIGILVTENSSADQGVQTLVIAVLQGVAGGTILYITFFEVLDREKKKSESGGISIIFILVGFAIMVGLQAIGK